jgi:hypothetical protein
LPFLIIGGFLWVFSSGFFDHFQRSVFLARTRNRKKKPDFMPLSLSGYGIYSFWLIIAGVLLVIAVLLLIFLKQDKKNILTFIIQKAGISQKSVKQFSEIPAYRSIICQNLFESCLFTLTSFLFQTSTSAIILRYMSICNPMMRRLRGVRFL